MTAPGDKARALEQGGESANRSFGNTSVGQAVAPCEDAEVAFDARPDDVTLEISTELEELPCLELDTELEESTLEVDAELE